MTQSVAILSGTRKSRDRHVFAPKKALRLCQSLFFRYSVFFFDDAVGGADYELLHKAGIVPGGVI